MKLNTRILFIRELYISANHICCTNKIDRLHCKYIESNQRNDTGPNNICLRQNYNLRVDTRKSFIRELGIFTNYYCVAKKSFGLHCKHMDLNQGNQARSTRYRSMRGSKFIPQIVKRYTSAINSWRFNTQPSQLLRNIVSAHSHNSGIKIFLHWLNFTLSGYEQCTLVALANLSGLILLLHRILQLSSSKSCFSHKNLHGERLLITRVNIPSPHALPAVATSSLSHYARQQVSAAAPQHYTKQICLNITSKILACY